MKPRQRHDDGAEDLFRSRLDTIINPRHELVRLAAAIDWHRFDEAFDPLFGDTGNPALPTRVMVGLHAKVLHGIPYDGHTLVTGTRLALSLVQPAIDRKREASDQLQKAALHFACPTG